MMSSGVLRKENPGEGVSGQRTLDLSNLAQRVYELLKASILRRELAPGQSLVISELAAQLGVSTTPVRDALKQLEAEELVVIHPRRGCSVATLRPRDVAELSQIRTIVETAAAEITVATFTDEQLARLVDLQARLESLASGQCYRDYAQAVELDYQAHLLIVAALGNSRLTELFGRLRAHRRMAPELYDPDNQHAQLDVLEHGRIVEAYRLRDPEAAKQAIRAHLERVQNDVLAQLARHHDEVGEVG
jgi:DNA-binding GntR family transcriptional regulator